MVNAGIGTLLLAEKVVDDTPSSMTTFQTSMRSVVTGFIVITVVSVTLIYLVTTTVDTPRVLVIVVIHPTSSVVVR